MNRADSDDEVRLLVSHWGEVCLVQYHSFWHKTLAKELPGDCHSSINLNRSLLFEALNHAAIDLRRMVDWHMPEALPDRHKHAAFVARWIAKSRPIQVCDGVVSARYPLTVNMINARFALVLFRSFLKRNIPQVMIPHLVYTFHFRDERGETLSLLAYACEELAARPVKFS